MTLPTPPPYNQLSAKLQPNDDCGETCVAAVVTCFGNTVTPTEVSGVRSGLTNASDLVKLFAHYGVAAVTSASPLEGHYNVVGIWSDAGGNPQAGSGIGHWLLQYGPDQYLNPYGGRLVTYTNLPLTGDYVNILGDPEMTLDTARTLVWAWFPSILGRRPEGQSAVDYWAARLAGGESGEQVLTDFCNTPEAAARLRP
jgi:hypothetical protein